MKIKKVECDQFAGMRGKEIEFTDGLNIVIGDNESGKSTMAALIYYLFFQDVKLHGRNDADFIDKYFPKTVSGPQGDVVDGILVFETPNGTYKLKKEWEKGEGTSRLILPNGTSIKGMEAINDVLHIEMKHREGVYREIVFVSQKSQQIAVESIMKVLSKKLDSLSETRNDLMSTLTQTALETGGVSLEKMENKLRDTLSSLDSRWDFDADMPEGGVKRGINNKWKQQVGGILEAYYALEDLRMAQEAAEHAEKAVEICKENLRELQTKKKEIESEKNEFQKFRGILEQSTLLAKAIEDQEMKIREEESALKDWPEVECNLMKAKELRKKLEWAVWRDLFLKADSVQKAYEAKRNELEQCREILPEDLKRLGMLQTKKRKNEGEIAGLNLAAKIRQLGTAPIEIQSLTSGDVMQVADGELKITEAVKIIIPDVMEMQLMPQDVDVDAIRENLRQITTEIKDIYAKYGVNALEDLEEMDERYMATKQEVDHLKLNLEKILGENTWEMIQSKNAEIPQQIESVSDIRNQIDVLCGAKSLEAFIGGMEQLLSGFVSKYETEEKLREQFKKTQDEKNDNKSKLDALDEIPEKFQGIDDPEQYDTDRQADIDDLEGQIKESQFRLTEAERKLGEKSAEEYSEELLEKQAEFEARKTEYKHWQNIYCLFCEMKEEIGSNPMEDIEEKFREYLEVISDGDLELTGIDETMTVQIASGMHALTFDTLSEGTKGTISLAFRLAMLEHIYPEGDGLALFDDPFTDMDPKRAQQSCKLIQKFAENNQVIFITCDDKYKRLMNGKVILLAK